MDHRTRHVEEFLRERLARVVRLDVYPIDTWTGSPFGWDPPTLHEGLFVFPHCPALIASLTVKMFVDDADDHLRAIVSCVSLHVIHHDVPEEERVRFVESVLYDTAPGSVELLSEIEFAALDART